MRYFLTDSGFIRSEPSLIVNHIDYSEFTELTHVQIDEFVTVAPPEGKRREGLSWIDKEVEIIPEVELIWVQTELDYVDIQLKYHTTGDTKRQQLTESNWHQYAIELRDYTSKNDDGRTVIVGAKRPERPI
jgi:hypothetical protein